VLGSHVSERLPAKACDGDVARRLHTAPREKRARDDRGSIARGDANNALFLNPDEKFRFALLEHPRARLQPITGAKFAMCLFTGTGAIS